MPVGAMQDEEESKVTAINEYETKEEALSQIPENEATVSTTIYDD